MGVGVLLPGGAMRMSDVAALAAGAEGAGADGVYVVEAWRSGFVPLAAVAAATSRVRVGTYVLNAYGRSPWLTALAAVDADDLSGGRVEIGIGSGNRFTNLMYQGLETERPLEKMRDYVEIFKRVSSGRLGKLVNYEGEVHSIEGWRPQVDPVRESIPVLLAATQPRMRRLAAEIADAVALGSLISEEYLTGPVRADVAAGAERAGREPGAVRVMVCAFVAVDEDRAVARRASRVAVVNLFEPKPHAHYEFLMREQGFGAAVDQVHARLSAGDREGALAAVPDELVDQLTVSGPEVECVRRVRSLQSVASDVLMLSVVAMSHRDTASPAGAAAALVASYQPLFRVVEKLAAPQITAAPR